MPINSGNTSTGSVGSQPDKHDSFEVRIAGDHAGLALGGHRHAGPDHHEVELAFKRVAIFAVHSSPSETTLDPTAHSAGWRNSMQRSAAEAIRWWQERAKTSPPERRGTQRQFELPICPPDRAGCFQGR
jgi:hypothetical protein